MTKTKTMSRKIKNKRKTMRNKSMNKNEMRSHIARVFLEMLNNVKLYHWKTDSYSQHKATDELYDRLNENIDKFIEILLGKEESRIKILKKHVDLLDTKNTYEFKSRMYEYREFLTEMNTIFDNKKDSDLLSVRDDILGDINQFLYLLTFNKA
jgi:DNA-binding ferritin-like protein